MAMRLWPTVLFTRRVPLERLALRALLAFAAFAAVAIAPLGSAGAQQARPLLLEGKSAVFQRVIAVPGARLAAAAGGEEEAARPVTPFSVFYVYARESADGR